jgi:hypothetical protein
MTPSAVVSPREAKQANTPEPPLSPFAISHLRLPPLVPPTFRLPSPYIPLYSIIFLILPLRPSFSTPTPPVFLSYSALSNPPTISPALQALGGYIEYGSLGVGCARRLLNHLRSSVAVRCVRESVYLTYIACSQVASRLFVGFPLSRQPFSFRPASTGRCTLQYSRCRHRLAGNNVVACLTEERD